jgi:hypothetical protein
MGISRISIDVTKVLFAQLIKYKNKTKNICL